MTSKAYAKINLYLDVLGKRPDGYHDIVSIMKMIDIYDTVSVDLTGTGTISVSCSDPSVPSDRRNTAYKCAELFFETLGIPDPGISIMIEKRIPVSGGLAGGSSDGAQVLRILKNMFSPECPESTLYTIGASVGADIPFCMRGGTAICTSKGDVTDTVPDVSNAYMILLVYGNGKISTGEAYAKIDRIRNRTRKTKIANRILDDLENGRIPSLLYNIFEEAADEDAHGIRRIKNIMYDNGALSALMSGSGPTVFGLFESDDKIEAARKALESEGFGCLTCRPVL